MYKVPQSKVARARSTKKVSSASRPIQEKKEIVRKSGQRKRRRDVPPKEAIDIFGVSEGLCLKDGKL